MRQELNWVVVLSSIGLLFLLTLMFVFSKSLPFASDPYSNLVWISRPNARVLQAIPTTSSSYVISLSVNPVVVPLEEPTMISFTGRVLLNEMPVPMRTITLWSQDIGWSDTVEFGLQSWYRLPTFLKIITDQNGYFTYDTNWVETDSKVKASLFVAVLEGR